MSSQLKLYRINIAPHPERRELLLDGGCEMVVLGTSGSAACSEALDNMTDCPSIAPPRVTIDEIKGPFEHGFLISMEMGNVPLALGHRDVLDEFEKLFAR